MITPHIAREVDLEVGDKTYRLARFTRKHLVEWMDFANKKLGDPLLEVKKQLDGFPLEIQKLLVEEALDRKRRRQDFSSPEIQALFSSNEGILKAICLLFKKHQPDMTPADVEAVFDEALEQHGVEFFQKVFSTTMGSTPKSEDEIQAELLEPEKKS